MNEAKLSSHAAAYAAPAQLRAGLGFYRATPENAEFNRTQNAPVDLPLTLVGGKQGIGPLMPAIMDALRVKGWSNVKLELLGAGHYLLDESPDALPTSSNGAPRNRSAIKRESREHRRPGPF